jgi:ribonuclease III
MHAQIKEMLAGLESTIGYRFDNRQLLVEALTHRSFINEAREPGLRDNQRLEFFGDAVLGLLVSSRLLDLFPASCEGSLSKARAALVDEETLATIAEGICLGECLTLGRGEEKTGGRKKKSVLADAFEALVAAVYLDGGIDAAKLFVDRFFCPLMESGKVHGIAKDHKTRFQELSQALYGTVPLYHVENISGPDHDRLFTVTACIGQRTLGRGRGRTKKEAEQSAAQEALAGIEREDVVETS